MTAIDIAARPFHSGYAAMDIRTATASFEGAHEVCCYILSTYHVSLHIGVMFVCELWIHASIPTKAEVEAGFE